MLAEVPTLHPRATLVPDAVTPALLRATRRGFYGGLWSGLAAGAIAAAAVSPVGGTDPIVIIVFAAAVSAVAGMTIWMASIPREIRIPFEGFAWLGSAEMRRFISRTGSRAPGNPMAMRAWVDRHPMAPSTALARVELLAALGDLSEARLELAAVTTPPADEIERVERASLATWLGFLESGVADLESFDAVAATLTPGSRAQLDAAVGRALAESRVRLDRREPDPLGPIAAVRPRLGPAATWVILRDGGRRLCPWLLLLGAGLGAFVAGVGVLFSAM